MHVDEAAAAEILPENGVPEVIVQEAYRMDEARYFKPDLDGPASARPPEAKEPGSVDAEAEHCHEHGEKEEHQQPKNANPCGATEPEAEDATHSIQMADGEDGEKDEPQQQGQSSSDETRHIHSFFRLAI